jgi:hypothetical protein
MCDIIMSAKIRRLENGRKSELSEPLVDLSPILEVYVTIFCKHLFYNPTVDRDIQIIILPQHSGGSPEPVT